MLHVLGHRLFGVRGYKRLIDQIFWGELSYSHILDFGRVKTLARMVCGLKSYLGNALKDGALVKKSLPLVVGLPPLEMSNSNR